jgi:CheY-like chemotaxis protein
MNTDFKHLPVILLVDSAGSVGIPAREWLQQSRFQTWEAMNAFEALEGISDFTLRSRPDVILLSVESVKDNFRLLSELLLQGGVDELEFPIFALSGCNAPIKDVALFEGDLAEIEAKLEEMVPMAAGCT